MIRNPFLEEVFDKAVQINLENDETAEKSRRSLQKTEDNLFLEDVWIYYTKIIFQSIKLICDTYIQLLKSKPRNHLPFGHVSQGGLEHVVGKSTPLHFLALRHLNIRWKSSFVALDKGTPTTSFISGYPYHFSLKPGSFGVAFLNVQFFSFPFFIAHLIFFPHGVTGDQM